MNKHYWDEAVRLAFESSEINATEEQILSVVESIDVSHDCYEMIYPSGPPDTSYKSDIRKLENELKIEKEKIHCRECNGYGTITDQGPYHSYTSRCWKCHGVGRHTRDKL